MENLKVVNMRDEKHLEMLKQAYQCETVSLSHACYTSIFSKLKGVIDKSGNMHLMSTTGPGLRRLKIGKYLYIEQNQFKDSEPAQRARAGNQIMWVIDTETNQYLARVENGKLVINKPKTQTV